MELDLSKVEFSRNDIRLNINTPKSLNDELAYFIGIHIGDGCLGNYKSSKYCMEYSGHLIDEKDFYSREFKELFKKLFNKDIKIKEVIREKRNCIKLSCKSKAIFTFINKVIAINEGPKKDIVIPMVIKNSKYMKYFLKGLADSDFCLSFKSKNNSPNNNPSISISSYSTELVKEVNKELNKMGFITYTRFEFSRKRYEKKYLSNLIEINGIKQLELWMKLIGFNSQKHLTKYLIWKKFGFCPPYTSLPEREAILKGDLNPYSFYKSTPKSL